MTAQPIPASHPAVSEAPSGHVERNRGGQPRTRRRGTDGGSLDRLSSGRWRVRWYDETGKRYSRTLPTKREAADYLATLRADQLRGTWRAPDLGATPLSDYAAEYLASRGDLRPRTRQLYWSLLARRINTELRSPRPREAESGTSRSADGTCAPSPSPTSANGMPPCSPAPRPTPSAGSTSPASTADDGLCGPPQSAAGLWQW